MQYAVTGAFLDMGLKLAVMRQLNSGWQSNFGGFDYNFFRKIPTFLMAFMITSPFGVALDMAQRAYYADKTFPK